MGFVLAQGSSTANAQGTARVTLGPFRAFESWQVTGLVVTVTGDNIARADVYRGHESSGSRIDSSIRANDDRSETLFTLQTGEQLICVFTDASVNAHCTFTIEGEKRGRGR
jgi:hypothetical protein